MRILNSLTMALAITALAACSASKPAGPSENGAVGSAEDIAAITAIVESMPKAQNADELTKDWASDVAYFDIVEDSAFSLDDFKKKIAKQFAALRNIRTKILDMKVRSDGQMAFAYSTQNFISDTVTGSKVDLIFRETDVFEKRGGKWLLVHQHLSLPVDIANDKVILHSTATIPPETAPGS